MFGFLKPLLALLKDNDGINDKSALSRKVADFFHLTQDRSVFYCDDFAIRFSAAASKNFANTVLSLSNLQKYDERPFFVCLVTPTENHLLIANTSFLKKISHSSQELRQNNIRGSFNGSDIMREFEGISNTPENLERLFYIHEGIGFDVNLIRLVEATNNISPTGRKFEVSADALVNILAAPKRAATFVASPDAFTLKAELDTKVQRFRNEILLAALIENINVRGRVIEYLIAGEDDLLRTQLVTALQNRTHGLPKFKTENALGDYLRAFETFITETDVKTKIMILDSNPKAYNLDKILDFLSADNTVFMFYFVGVDPAKIVNTVLVSMFQTDLLDATVLLKHWAGRNSRGVTQLEGKAVGKLILQPAHGIDQDKAIKFLSKIVAL